MTKVSAGPSFRSLVFLLIIRCITVRDPGFSIVKDPTFSSNDTPKSKYEKLENRISEPSSHLKFIFRTAGFDASDVRSDELETLLRQKDGESVSANSPPLRTSSGNHMGEGPDLSLLAGKHVALFLEIVRCNPAHR